MDGIEQLICCSVEGEVRGYKAMPGNALDIASDRNVNQEALREMNQRKQVNKFLLVTSKLEFELKFKKLNQYKESIARAVQFRRSI